MHDFLSDLIPSQFTDQFIKTHKNTKSNLSGFYNLSIDQRQNLIFSQINTTQQKQYKELINRLFTHHHTGNNKKSKEKNHIDEHYLKLVDLSIENALGYMPMPFGIATYLQVNHCELPIPMVTEEPSIIAGLSHCAKIARTANGVFTGSSSSIMKGQIELRFAKKLYTSELKNLIASTLTIEKKRLIKIIAKNFTYNLQKRQAGIKDISWYFIDEINICIVTVMVDTLDAMGANKINQVCEGLKPYLTELFPQSEVGIAILSNLCLDRIAQAKCMVPVQGFNQNLKEGLKLINSIEKACLFAEHDIHRAVTHNKGIMNAVIAICLATANDCRAVSAACHSYASLSGKYSPLSKWRVYYHQKTQQYFLQGKITLPISVGVVGGMTKTHPIAKLSLEILGNPSSCQLAEIIAASALIQNLAALKALCSEGINKGHLKLHNKKTQL